MPQACIIIDSDTQPSTKYMESGNLLEGSQPLEKLILETRVSSQQNIPKTTYAGLYLVKETELIKTSEIVDEIQDMGISIEGREDVEKYLFLHSVLAKNIIRICKLIKAEFKEIKNIVVRTYRDIENPSVVDLFIGLKAVEETDDITDKIGKLYDSGALSFLRGSGGWIQIDTDI